MSEKKKIILPKRQLNMYMFLRWLVKPFIKAIFKYRYELIPKVDGPCLVLSNHNTDVDCIFLGLAARNHIKFVATEKIARMGFGGKLVRRYFDPILHFKGKQGLSTVRNILANIKSGISVAMFPEGNRSFNGVTCPIPEVTGKLAKSCGGTLVTYRFVGGYLSTPRWGKGIRKGRITGQVAGIYSLEKLAQMSESEVYEAIVKDLYVDAYEEQSKERVAFKGKNKAEGIESTLFMCPKCHMFGTLKSFRERVSCACGYDAEYDEYGYLSSEDGAISVAEADAGQRSELERLAGESNGKLLFEDSVECETIGKNHEVISTEATTVKGFADRLEIGKLLIPFEKLEGIAINQRNLLILHITGQENHLECSGNISFNALKYLYLARFGGRTAETL